MRAAETQSFHLAFFSFPASKKNLNRRRIFKHSIQTTFPVAQAVNARRW